MSSKHISSESSADLTAENRQNPLITWSPRGIENLGNVVPDDSATTSPEDMLRWAMERFGRLFAIVTSFQDEGMVLIDMASRIAPDFRVITLDTGRLPEQTYGMIDLVHARYGIRPEIVSPDAGELERMTARHGANLFRENPEFRKLCCHIRKTRPLERKLASVRAWAVGLRRDQTAERATLERIEETGGRLKISPLAFWSHKQVSSYIASHAVPRHPLYAEGYASIGCAPCTRALEPGETGRAGRWWWESDAAKECGIHVTQDGTARRTLDVLLEEISQR
jgi:phosphoadenylyl-sulfate reductase (thioredoxin)